MNAGLSLQHCHQKYDLNVLDCDIFLLYDCKGDVVLFMLHIKEM